MHCLCVLLRMCFLTLHCALKHNRLMERDRLLLESCFYTEEKNKNMALQKGKLYLCSIRIGRAFETHCIVPFQ